jgi:hypothetical protein
LLEINFFSFFLKKDLQGAAEETPKSISNGLRIHYPTKTHRQNDGEDNLLGLYLFVVYCSYCFRKELLSFVWLSVQHLQNWKASEASILNFQATNVNLFSTFFSGQWRSENVFSWLLKLWPQRWWLIGQNFNLTEAAAFGTRSRRLGILFFFLIQTNLILFS